MKISIDIMKQYSGEEQWTLTVPELVTKIGRQLGAVEETLDLTGNYDGVVVADIVEVAPHPNADKLNIYQAFDGQETVQVVSGDRQIQAGDKVAWIKPGATVPSTWGTDQPLVLEARPMRGEISNGMFGSGKELAINDDHERVLILDTDAPAGTPFSQVYGLDDAIIDIENKMFTHRPDLFGNLGVARELAGIQDVPFVSPEWYMANAPFPTVETDLALTVANEIPALVPRFVALPIANVSISPSPLWLQSQLNRLGVRPINNIVDITNYYMVLTGQPLHAYDYDKVKALSGGREAQLIVRKPKAGETIEMLNGKIITPHPDAMMVAAGETLACVGGMIGGANTEVDEHTKNIILEAATWDMFSIRRTSMHHGIFTDAVTRFSKGQSPLQNSAVAAKAALEIKKLTGALIGEAVDDNHVAEDARARASLHAPITTTSDYINVRLGTQLTAEEMAVTLNNVEIAVETHGDQLIITPPFWRTDLEIPEDIVEEIGRLRGYDQLPHELPTRSTHAVPLQPLEDLKNQIRDILAAAGANELQTYSFVPKKLLEDVGQNAEHAFAIRNALSPELQHYRMSLTPGLLDKVHANIKAGYKEFALFEVNKIHIKGKDFEECDGLPREFQTIAFVFASDHPLPGAAYYYAKKYLDYLLAELGVPSDVRPADVEPVFEIGRQIFAPFEPKRAGFVYVGKGEPANFAGFVGEYRGQVAKRLKLPKTVAGFEIDLERLLQHRMKGTYRPILRFPSTDQDVCFKVTADKTYGEVRALVAAALAGNPELRVTIAPLDIYQRSDDQAHKQITFRITLQHAERTLTTDEVNDLLDAVVEHVAATIGAERV